MAAICHGSGRTTSGKVKRIRRNPQVRVAVCTAGGRLRGEQVPAVAEILPDSEAGVVERLIADSTGST